MGNSHNKMDDEPAIKPLSESEAIQASLVKKEMESFEESAELQASKPLVEPLGSEPATAKRKRNSKKKMKILVEQEVLKKQVEMHREEIEFLRGALQEYKQKHEQLTESMQKEKQAERLFKPISSGMGQGKSTMGKLW